MYVFAAAGAREVQLTLAGPHHQELYLVSVCAVTEASPVVQLGFRELEHR